MDKFIFEKEVRNLGDFEKAIALKFNPQFCRDNYNIPADLSDESLTSLILDAIIVTDCNLESPCYYDVYNSEDAEDQFFTTIQGLGPNFFDKWINDSETDEEELKKIALKLYLDIADEVMIRDSELNDED